MPNHVTSYIQVEADSIEVLSEFVEKYSTKHPAKAGRSSDGNLRYRKEDGSRWGNVGFLNESTGEFKVRNLDKDVERAWDIVQGVPEGYEIDIDEEWFQFPDFNKIIPMPEHSDTFFAEGGLGSAERQKFGQNNWYDWSIENWRTKWNSYSHKLIQSTRWLDMKYTVTYKFETAWSAVPQLIEMMAKDNPEVSIVYTYADEDMGYNTGEFKYENGEQVYMRQPEGGSNEALDLYLQTHPDRKDDFLLKNGELVHKEDLGYEYSFDNDTYIKPKIEEIEE